MPATETCSFRPFGSQPSCPPGSRVWRTYVSCPRRREFLASGLDAEVRERRRRELRRFCLIGKPQLLAPGARPPRELPEVRFPRESLSVGGIRAALKLR